jgi:hypothetical protein
MTISSALVAFAGADGTVLVHARHVHGDPGEDVEQFLNAVADEARDEDRTPETTGFHDPGLLAARYVAWLTNGSVLSGNASIVAGESAGCTPAYVVRCHAAPSLDRPGVKEVAP